MPKTILITGSTDGIGKHLATKLAGEGHEVILHGRNPQKLQMTRQEIQERTGSTKLHAYLADLSRLSDVLNLAKEISRDFDKIDVLVNNAGLFTGQQRQLTEDGVELTFMLSVLVSYVLTKEVMPLLEKSDAGRVINTSSFMHHLAKPKGLDFNLYNSYTPNLAYYNAKLYNICLTKYQARELANKGSKITVNTYHPGLIATNIGNDTSDDKTNQSLMLKVMNYFKRSLDEGIKTAYYLVMSDQVATMSGHYFDDNKLKWVSLKCYTDRKAQALINFCEEKVREASDFSLNK